jgi:D-sedoheptulose 7-phosphate isomerase
MEVVFNPVSDYLEKLNQALGSFPTAQVVKLGSLLLQRRDLSTLFIAGNGGSATTASHMAADLGVGSIRRHNPLKVVSLCDNTAVITAISNDLSFEDVFATQITLLAKPGDVFISFSASGNSLNILNAIRVAKSLGVYTVAITGFDGGSAKNEADLSVHIESAIGNYGVVEDVHLSVSHILTEVIRNSYE